MIPFRQIGCIDSGASPLQLEYKGDQLFLTSNIGRSYHVYDAKNISLQAVSPQLEHNILSLVTMKDITIVATHCNLYLFDRSTLVQSLVFPKSQNYSHMMILHNTLIVAPHQGSEILIYTIKTRKGYTDVILPENATEQEIASIHSRYSLKLFKTSKLPSSCHISFTSHLPSFINKILIGTEQGHVLFWDFIGSISLCTLSSSKIWPENIPVTCIEPVSHNLFAVGFESGLIIMCKIKQAGSVYIEKCLFQFLQEDSSVTSLSFSSDGTHLLASGSPTGDVVLWDLQHKKLLSIMEKCHESKVSTVEFVNNNSMLITSSVDNSIKQWVYEKQTPGHPVLLKQRYGHSKPCRKVFLYPGYPNEPSSHRIFSSGDDCRLFCLSLVHDETNQELSQKGLPKYKLSNHQLAPIIDLSSSRNRERDWDSITTVHENCPLGFSWSFENKKINKIPFEIPKKPIIPTHMLSAERLRNQLWDTLADDWMDDDEEPSSAIPIASLNQINDLDENGSDNIGTLGTIGKASFSKRQNIDNSRNLDFEFLERSNADPFQTNIPLSCTSVSSCGNFSFFSNIQGRIDKYSIQHHKYLATCRLTPKEMWMKENLRARKKLGSFGVSDSTRQDSISESESGESKNRSFHSKPISFLTSTPLNQYVVSASLDKTMKIWSFDDLCLVDTFSLDHACLFGISHPQASVGALVLENSEIWVYNFALKKCLRKFNPTSRPSCLAFSQNLKWLFCCTQDCFVHIYDMISGRLLYSRQLVGMATSIAVADQSVVFAIDGQKGISLYSLVAQSTAELLAWIDVHKSDENQDENQNENQDDLVLSNQVEQWLNSALNEESTFIKKSKPTVGLLGSGNAAWLQLPFSDIIAERNKPIEAPKAPQHKTLFLDTLLAAKKQRKVIDEYVSDITPSWSSTLNNTTDINQDQDPSTWSSSHMDIDPDQSTLPTIDPFELLSNTNSTTFLALLTKESSKGKYPETVSFVLSSTPASMAFEITNIGVGGFESEIVDTIILIFKFLLWAIRKKHCFEVFHSLLAFTLLHHTPLIVKHSTRFIKILQKTSKGLESTWNPVAEQLELVSFILDDIL